MRRFCSVNGRRRRRRINQIVVIVTLRLLSWSSSRDEQRSALVQLGDAEMGDECTVGKTESERERERE